MRLVLFALFLFLKSALFAQQEPCSIQNLQAIVGDCNDDSTYQLTVNFTATNTGNTTGFDLWANGAYYGFFQLSQLPLNIAHFPTNGGTNDVVKVCMNDLPNCCAVKEFPVPNCNPVVEPCFIDGLAVETGDCNADGTYALTVNFALLNAPNATHFNVWANNNSTLVGSFPLSQLPLTIPAFPTNGGANDVIKICIAGVDDCCKIKEFPIPNCNPTEPCSIQNLQAIVGDCNSDSTYQLTVNFTATNTGNTTGFDLWSNGAYYGFFQLSQLPLNIAHFPTNGGTNDVVKVCMNDLPNCCAVKEFPVPNCNPVVEPCFIDGLAVETGDCNADGTYALTVNFALLNAPNATHFNVWANNNSTLVGSFPLSQLPLTIPAFPTNGGANDVIKVCIAGVDDCCKIKEFPIPNCNPVVEPCLIDGLAVETGDCNADGTYALTVNFSLLNAPNATHFNVWANNNTTLLGNYAISQLPLTIPAFPTNGGANDVIKVCITGVDNCCKIKEFPVPNCNPVAPCIQPNIDINIGDCNADGTYHLAVDFEPLQSIAQETKLYIYSNNILTDSVQFEEFPIVITDFVPTNGADEDTLMICYTPEIDYSCCAYIKWISPNCFSGGGNDGLQLMPNPLGVDGMLHGKISGASANSGEGTVLIFDALGNEVKSKVVPMSNNFEIDLNLLPSGWYSVQLISPSFTKSAIFIKEQ